MNGNALKAAKAFDQIVLFTYYNSNCYCVSCCKMKLTVKNLKGEKFDVEVEESLTVQEVKSAIVRILVRFAARSQLALLFLFYSRSPPR